MQRRAWIDVSPGETRGVVELDGRPEHLLLEREGELGFARLGARYAGRVTAVVPPGAFVDLGDGSPGWIPNAARPLVQGALILVEIVAEARAGKGPRLRLVGPAEGRPGLLTPAPELEATLCALSNLAPADIARGEDARAAADRAQDAALATRHAFRGGLTLTIEPTRALVAIDVDVAPGTGAGARRETDLRAVREAARLLRLKALGGAIAIDLAGLRPAAGPVRAEAAAVFAADGADVRVWPLAGPGLLLVTKPHGRRPIGERLLDAEGSPSAATVAAQLLRDAAREAAADPGARFRIEASAVVAAALAPGLERLGPRFSVRAAAGLAPARTDIFKW